MTSSQIRRSFLDFFKSKEHTLVPSASLLPDSPNLLFTNAGMNQFVPIFLGQKRPDVSRWAGATPGRDTRAADTQKCIRAGGKHNDLEDVGLDTYHHTFFEMLGNWSFGDYFKQEAIEWAWELVVQQWHFPPQRLYATVYQPGPGDPADFDHEAWAHWERLFKSAGLDPAVHIRTGGKKDNFWMMGDTGPCGPCSELHVDLSPGPRETDPLAQQAGAQLVNQGTPRCIEIWNLVFIQFNANPDGTFSPLPARHVDTGMGFERVTSIIQGTQGLTDFANARISNYETDIFRPLFDALENLSGKKYGSTLPTNPSEISDLKSQIATDVAFRVIADHIRTLGFAVADGILPSNEGRGYVLRRILRRAVRYGRTLGFHEPFFHKLVAVLADTMGDVFPEIRARRAHVEEVIRVEEEAFNKTLDRGIELFNQETSGLMLAAPAPGQPGPRQPQISGSFAFKLYDTYGFPLDLTELMARERGLTVDVDGFNRLMEEQRARARAAQKKTVVELSQIETQTPTRFVGYDTLEIPARVLEVVQLKDQTAVILDTSACYAEMGGQVGDTGELQHGSRLWRIANTQKSGPLWLHLLDTRQPESAGGDADLDAPLPGMEVTVTVNRPRREAIQRHHTVTHLLHWALRQVVGRDLSQKGSFVGPDKLTFDFNSAPLTPAQVADVERLVNERILDDAPVSWIEVKYDHIRHRPDILQFFGEKYGDWVRVVQIGGKPGGLDGYAMELCGGTHTRATGQIGLFRIVSENAIATGVRRIEAVAGLEAYRQANAQLALLKTVADRVSTPLHELDRRVENLLAQLKALEKQLRAAQQKEAATAAATLLARAVTLNGIPAIIERFDAGADTLQELVNELKGRFQGVVLLGGAANNAVTLVAAVSPQFTAKVQAGKLIQQIAPLVGGKGGGRPDGARGGGKDIAKLDEALARARTLLG